MRNTLLVVAQLLASCTSSDETSAPEPVIDVHLHAMLLEDSDPPNEHSCLEFLALAPTIDPVRQPLLANLADKYAQTATRRA